MKKIIPILLLGIILTLPAFSLAQDDPIPGTGGASGEVGEGPDIGTGGSDTGSGRLPNLLGVDSADGLIDKILVFLMKIGAPIFVLFVLIGAFQIMFAAGNAEKWKTGKNTIIYAVIGYAIILIANGIDDVIRSFFNS
ncbi:MAG: pilin [bacterium]|nr:pilin [bacterium]